MKGMILSVLRNAELGDCTNGGITSKVKKVTVTGNWYDGTPIPKMFEPSPDAPEMVIGSHVRDHFYARPVNEPDVVGWMFGGNYIVSSDSRCPRYPIPVHDRQETHKEYASQD